MLEMGLGVKEMGEWVLWKWDWAAGSRSNFGLKMGKKKTFELTSWSLSK